MTGLRIAPDLELPLDLVTEATAIVATRGAGKSSASAVIVEEGFETGVQTVVFDRTGVYWGLRSNAKGSGAGLAIYVLGGAHGDVPLEAAAGGMIADLVVDSGHSFVLDFSDFSKGEATSFAADFLERIYDRKARSRSTTLLVIDEAHFYAPQTPRGGFKGPSARLMGAMEDVVGLGRSRGLGVVLTTQRTQSLNKAVLDLIETLLVMRMLSPRARAAVKDWIQEKHEEDEQGVLASLGSLPTGTAWVWSPLRGILQKIAVRRIHTFDSYETPTPGKVRAEPKARKELNLDELGEQIAATVERAKADDPVELRKRIAQLQRQVDSHICPVPEPVEPVRIEVPVLAPEIIDQLEALLEPAATLLGETQETLLKHRMWAEQQLETTRAPKVSLSGRRRPDTGATVRTATQPAAPRPVRTAAGGSDQATGQGTPDSDGEVTKPMQRVLDAIAWLNAVGFPEPSKVQTGLIAGYRVGKKVGGNYGNILSTLRTAGLVEYPSPSVVAFTDAGRAVATPVDIEPTTEGLQQAIFARLSDPEQRVLAGIVDAYPDPLHKQDAGEQAGYSVGPKIGGNFGNILSRLRSLGLVDYPAPSLVVATDVLFLGAEQ